MKTRILLAIAFLINIVGIAQINVSESFETSIPAGWTQFGEGFTRQFTSLSCNGSYSLSAQSSSSSIFYSYIQTPNYVSSGQPITVSLDYKTTSGESYGTVFIFYEVNNSGNRVNAGQYAVDIYCNNLSVTIPATAVPSGTNIKFSFQLNRAGGFNPLQMDNVAITQLASAPTPIVSNVNVTAITTNSASVNYSINANNTATTSVIKYGLSSGNLTNSATGFSATGNTTNSGTTSLTGLNPNTQYYYRVEATNLVGMTPSVESSFTTLAVGASIAEYNFNGTLNNINGTTPFSNASNNVFVQDRNGNAGQALNLVNGTMVAAITNIPIGNAARSVSVWVRPTAVGYDNLVFNYGAQNSNNTYGFSFTASTINNYAWGANDLSGSAILSAGVWKHIVCTYSATGQATVYIDGVSVLTGARPTWDTILTSFSIGGFDGYIDDLKIYNYALSQADITSLFTNNTLSSQNFNQNNLEVSLYPNPANDVLNIEMTNEVKTIEIYNIQGQKVKSANQKQINVSDLAAGMYMIRIQDADNAVSTKKFLKQ